MLILHPKVLFGQIWSRYLKIYKVTEILYRVHCCMFVIILIIIFSKFLSVIHFWTNLIPKSNVNQIDWNLIQGLIVICWSRLLMWNFSSNLLIIIFWGKFRPKLWCFPHSLAFSLEIQWNSVNLEKTRWNEICP